MLLDGLCVGNVEFDESESVDAKGVGQIRALLAGRIGPVEVVDPDHLVRPREQPVYKVGSDEPSRTSH